MKKIASFMFVFAFSNNLFAANVVESVQAVCLSPSQQGKYWKVDAGGKAEANGLVRLIGVAINGEASFSKGEWEGVQQVLAEQRSADNANYRDCAKTLTPLFMKKFTATKPVKPNKGKNDAAQKNNAATPPAAPATSSNTVTGDQNVTGTPINTGGGDVTFNFGAKP